MKLIIVLVCVLDMTRARPAGSASGNEVTIVRYENVALDDGGYHFLYETSDGSTREETGHLINVGTDQEAIAVHGSFSYLGLDGVQYTVNYVADEDGFQPQGAHLPNAADAAIQTEQSVTAFGALGALQKIIG